jgi:hypothetical protein
MSIALLCVSRRGQPRLTDGDLGTIAARIRPENLDGAPFARRRAEGALAVVFRPGPYAQLADAAVAVGLCDDAGSWAAPGTPLPEHAAAILRASADAVEILTDVAGTRTVWYALTGDELIASTSQRALLAALGSFEMNRGAIPWMLASGSLGPRLSWDRRVACVPPDATLRLDRASWQVGVTRRPAVWSGWLRGGEQSKEQHLGRLREALDETFRALPIRDDMLLPLSGGYDSRCILLSLLRVKPAGARIRALTWGTREAMDRPGTDASVARELCRALGVEHRYQVLAPESLRFEDVFRRFVAVGEGRNDHLAGYTDGFALWRSLAESGVGCVLRGDMGFGYPAVSDERDVRLQTGIPRVDDFENLAAFHGLRAIEMPWPDYMLRGPGESCDGWNGRLGHEFRLATTMAALTHLKTAFVEVLNPLLSRRILECARTLPPSLFLEKRGFKRLVEERSPPVPFARFPAIVPPGDLYASAEAGAHLRDLLGERGRRHLPADLIAPLLSAVAPAPARRGLSSRLLPAAKRAVKALLPAWGRGLLRGAYHRRIDLRKVAFRAAILTAACDLLDEDARLLGARS